METRRVRPPVLVACPDARPPAFEAVAGLSRAGLLGGFLTSSYYKRDAWLASLARRIAPGGMARLERILLRRNHPDIPPAAVRTVPSFDLALKLEARFGEAWPGPARRLARWRTERFDAQLARVVEKARPEALLLFSDVGSAQALPMCRRLGIPSIVSMVHGDVLDEEQVLETEAAAAPDFMPLYLGSGALDRVLLRWLHERRKKDLELADRILVPSDHIARRLVRHGTSSHKLRVIPYAADCRRFRPLPSKAHGPSCTFLFAGGISQRKGIKYLLEAWLAIRRPNWRLQLLGPLPREPGPLAPYLDAVELLGRVSHAEMPARLAAADVFVFPSLFEGSAVVTYEALACGLPSVVTPDAGSVLRDGIEGFLVPPRDVGALAARMERLALDPGLRVHMALAARARALAFDWPRYHEGLVATLLELVSNQRTPADGRAESGERQLAKSSLSYSHI
jgi:glycosyltransferase involved in cell wall biosynthesis